MFFGTPHQGGGGVAFGKILVNAGSLFLQTSNKLLKNLERDSEFLSQQLEQYTQISSDFATTFAYEIYKTPLPTGGHLLVSLTPMEVSEGSGLTVA